MKTISNIMLIVVCVLTMSFSVQAGNLEVYPLWGYNTEDKLCQIKQVSVDQPSNEELKGEYWSLRECRSSNPEIIFYTGRGILIWGLLLVMGYILHFHVLDRFKERTQLEKSIFFLQDIVAIFLALFFLILLQHYYNIPQATYPYTSDVDHILYSTLIQGRIPSFVLIVYLLIRFFRILLFKKNN